MCPVKFDRSNLIGLKNRFKMAQKVNVEPDMATYRFSTVMYKYLITKYLIMNTVKEVAP